MFKQNLGQYGDPACFLEGIHTSNVNLKAENNSIKQNSF